MRPVYRAAIAVLGGLAVTGGAGAVWYKVDRTAMVQAVCKAGGPNLSRPRAVPAYTLRCAVLGPKRQISGTLETSFENSTLFIGPKTGDAVLGNDTAWFWTTEGLSDRGGAALRKQLDTPLGGTCGVQMASVTAEGWMTVSEGEFGHMGGWTKEFYADRIVSAGPPPAEAVAEIRRMAVDAGMPVELCAQMDAR